MTLSNYLSFLGIPPQQHIANFLEETIICSLQNSLQKFNNCPPWSFFFQVRLSLPRKPLNNGKKTKPM